MLPRCRPWWGPTLSHSCVTGAFMMQICMALPNSSLCPVGHRTDLLTLEARSRNSLCLASSASSSRLEQGHHVIIRVGK